MKSNKKLMIGILITFCIVFVIGTAVFAAGTAKKVLTRQKDQSAPATEDYIGEEKAKSIALDHIGLSEDEVTFIQTKLDYDDGIAEYEIEFYKDTTEYDYSIDAKTGTIRSYDSDAEGHHIPDQSDNSSSNIQESEAIKAALDHAGLTETEVSRLTAKFDHDDGHAEYEVEFYVDRTEYNYEIDAVTGEIISYDKEIDD